MSASEDPRSKPQKRGNDEIASSEDEFDSDDEREPSEEQEVWLDKVGSALGVVAHGAVTSKQGARMYRVPQDNIDALDPKKKGTKLEQMFDGTDQVSDKTSFEGKREKQILRWLATVLFGKYSTGVEIQCYFDGTDIWVSSNTNDVNSAISGYLPQGGDVFAKLGLAKSGGKAKSRGERHAKKLGASADAARYPEQAAIVTALKAGRIKVPPTAYDFDLHAERRIGLAVGSLNAARLGGVKRPCMVCAYALGLDTDKTRSGPLWTSAAARGGKTIDEVLQHAEENGIKTFITRDRLTKKLTTDHDTDSESEGEIEEQPEVAMVTKKPRGKN